MRREGTIVRWNPDKGFGFIRSRAIAQDVFVHARDCRLPAGEIPREGLWVTFEDVHVGGKGPRAVAVRAAQEAGTGRTAPSAARAPAPRQQRRPVSAYGSGALWALPLMAAYGLALAWLVWQRQAPWWLLAVSMLLNMAAFFAYWQDKYAAQQGRWRVKEDTLHLWSLAGGWIGAWFAQQVLRHKSVKASFRAAYGATVVMHCVGACGIWWFLRTA